MTAGPTDRLWPMGLTALAVLVLGWRAAALLDVLAGPREEPVTTADALLTGALGVIGVIFVLVGLRAVWSFNVPATRLFALYAAFAGLHWGGPLQLSSGQLQTGLDLAYVLLSGILAQSLLLHFTFTYPDAESRARTARLALYGPVLLALAVALALLAAPQASPAREALKGAFLAIYLLQTNLYAGLAALTVATSFRRASPRERRRSGLGVLLLALAGPGLLYLAVEAIEAVEPGAIDPAGLGTEPFHLFFVLTPLGIAHAVSRRPRDVPEVDLHSRPGATGAGVSR